jgi:hypothetical protein
MDVGQYSIWESNSSEQNSVWKNASPQQYSVWNAVPPSPKQSSQTPQEINVSLDDIEDIPSKRR